MALNCVFFFKRIAKPYFSYWYVDYFHHFWVKCIRGHQTLNIGRMNIHSKKRSYDPLSEPIFKTIFKIFHDKNVVNTIKNFLTSQWSPVHQITKKYARFLFKHRLGDFLPKIQLILLQLIYYQFSCILCEWYFYKLFITSLVAYWADNFCTLIYLTLLQTSVHAVLLFFSWQNKHIEFEDNSYEL